MNKAYNRIIWENQPSTASALGATNLNKMDIGISTIDDRVIAMDTTKADTNIVNNLVQSITYNESNGTLTITKQNGTSTNIDTKLEKLAVNFTYNPTTQKLIITLDDKTTQEVDLSSLISQYEFANTSTIGFVLDSGVVKANVVDGSITASKLQPNYLADITVQAQTATSQANKSKRYSVGGVETGDTTDNAKYYKEQAELFKNQAKTYRDEAEDISGVGVATDAKLGLVKGNGNVEVRTDGAMWANPYKDKASLSSPFITCPVSDDGLVHITKIEGESKQVVTVEGKNKFDSNISSIPLSGITNSGITITRSLDGVFTVNGTSTSGFAIQIYKYKSDRPYTVSMVNNVLSNGSAIQITDVPVTTALKALSFSVANNSLNMEYANEVYIRLQGNSAGITFTNYTFKLQIELGTVATTYEPFTPNSPSPEYPSPILYARDFDVITSNKNIIRYPFSDSSRTLAGITYVVNKDGTISATGTSNGYNVFNLLGNVTSDYKTVKFIFLKNVSYISQLGAQLKYRKIDGGYGLLNHNTAFTPTEDIPVGCLYFEGINVGDTVNKTYYPQLEIGKVATSYEINKSDKINISFPFMGFTGGTKNTMDKTTTGMNRSLRVKEYVFNGTEAFFRDSTNISGKGRFKLPITDVVISESAYIIGNVICSHFKNVQALQTWSCTHNGISVNSASAGIHIYNEEFATYTEAQFKAWVKTQYDKGTPLTIQYPLATPIYTPIDPIYLKSWNGITHLFTNSSPQVSLTANFKSELWTRDFNQDNLLNNAIYMDDDGELSDVIPTDSDLLGGKPKSYFEELVQAVSDRVTANLNSIDVINSKLVFEPWKSVTLLEGWTGTFYYAKNGLSQTCVFFTLGTGTKVSEGTIIAIIPEGYRPRTNMAVPVFKSNLAPYESLLGMYITATGYVTIRQPLSNSLPANIPTAGLSANILYYN